MRRLRVGPIALVAWLSLAVSPPPALGAGVVFGEPTATSQMGSNLTFSTTFQAADRPSRVELLSHLPSETVVSVQDADLTQGTGGSWSALVEGTGHVTPNTTFVYRFRAVTVDGVTLGPEARYTVVDDRFTWKTKQGAIVRLHWYEGDDAFADRALKIADDAIAGASQLLGVTETEPIDFFIYTSLGPFRDALGPGARENVGGQANLSIRTLFGLIEPSQIGSSWVDVLVTHELTHQVFYTAVSNPYHFPPRWLNEGLAVYQSEGYSAGDRAQVRNAASSGDLMPLDGIAGLFPTTYDRFSLAYAESVSAVDFFIRTYGKATLVTLIRSYAKGVTDNEAFKAAVGEDVAAFSDEWMKDQGASRPQPVGPQPAPTGPIPPDWYGQPAQTPVPGTSSPPATSSGPATSLTPRVTAGATAAPTVIATSAGPSAAAPSAAAPTPSPSRAGTDAHADTASGTAVLAGAIGVAILSIGVAIWALWRRREPPPPGWRSGP